MYMVTLIRH